ncbi:MAG: hypothetical protein OXC37_06365 [Bdellovibrionaceae bacterium]|nr:hypothetical protein [Pseudobdellovibrionaceae bacterium]
MFHSILYKALLAKFPRFKIASIFITLSCGIGYVDAYTGEKIDSNCSIKTIYRLISNCPQTPDWLKKANIKTSSETVSIRKDGYVIWHNGVWWKGTWEKGTWWKGTWVTGAWKDGNWLNGNWLNGTWWKGTWWDGTWKNGTWKNGNWLYGTWEKGTWVTGVIRSKIGNFIRSDKAPGSN